MERFVDEKELKRLKKNEIISAHQELLLVKKQQILTILRDLEPAEARHILNGIRRKYENDDITEEFFLEKEADDAGVDFGR